MVANAERAIERLEAQLRNLLLKEEKAKELLKKIQAGSRARRRAGKQGEREKKAETKAIEKARKNLADLKAKRALWRKQIERLRRCIRVWQDEKQFREKDDAKRRAKEARLRRKEARRHRAWHAYLDARRLNLEVPPELAAKVPPIPGQRDYTREEMEQVSEWVCAWLRRHLEQAARDLRGVAFVYRYPETLEVDGRLIFRLPDDEDRSEAAARISDVLMPLMADVDFQREKGASKVVVETLYWHELWVQAGLTAYAHAGYKSDSPKDRSRVLPGGIRALPFESHWRRGDLSVPLETLFQIEADLLERLGEREEEDEVRVEQLELRFHWNPNEQRPDRVREAATQTNCGGPPA